MSLKLTIIALTICGAAGITKAETTDSIAIEDNFFPSLSSMTGEELNRMRLSESHKIIAAGQMEPEVNEDSIARTVALFYLDQFRSFSDPQVPYFLFMSKDAKLAMGIGGSVRMRAWGDFDGSVPTNGFVPYMIPVPSNPDQRRRIGGTPGGTALFFKVVGRNVAHGDFIGYIQCDFSGTNNVGFKLKKAYVTWKDWTLGWAATTFSDPAAEAPTIDGAGQNGKISHTTMLIRWMHTIKKHWEIAASLELPSSSVDADGTMAKALDDYLPDVAVFGQYQWSHDQHIRLSAVTRSIPYRDLINNQRHTIFGWGLQLSTLLYPIPRFGIYGQLSYGRGYQSYMGDLAVGQYDLVADKSTPGKLYAPEAIGANVGFKYNFSEKIYAAVALGQVRYLPDYSVEPTDYKYGQYAAVNLFYQPTSRILAGIEYLRGARHNFNGETGTANRIDVLFQFAF